MSIAADGLEQSRDTRRQWPPRSGMPWTEDDFAAVFAASRDGCDPDEIAARIGRSTIALRGQLRRLLPAEERHLPADLVLPRLRQLDREGDYDWLAAMASSTRPSWELQREAQAERDERGIGALSDGELLALVDVICGRTAQLPDELVRAISTAVDRRGMEALVRRRAMAAADDAVDALLDQGERLWSHELPSDGWS